MMFRITLPKYPISLYFSVFPLKELLELHNLKKTSTFVNGNLSTVVQVLNTNIS